MLACVEDDKNRRREAAQRRGIDGGGGHTGPGGGSAGISQEALKRAEEFIEADEGAINRLSGFAGRR